MAALVPPSPVPKSDNDNETKKTSIVECLDIELKSLLKECQEVGLSQEEITQLFTPLTSLTSYYGNGNQHGTADSNKGRKYLIWGLVILTAACFFGGFPSVIPPEMNIRAGIRFHGLALIRILLVKILPFWNWTGLYYSRCLIRNPFYENQDLSLDDCNLCETLDSVERLSNLTQNIATEEYIKRDRPFIVTDAMNEWPIMKTDHFWFDNITELYLEQDKYLVCNLNTNLRFIPGDLSRVLRKLYSPHTQQWFLHWENCQKDGAKATRQFYRRPYFVSNSLDFTGSNWVLMSSDFRGRVYKKLETGESLSMVYQMRGSNHIRVSPRETCRGHCPELSATLYEGEILVVTNILWMVEYIPEETGDNLAVLSEVSWSPHD